MKVGRTYAGASRSFLVSMTANSLGQIGQGTPLDESQNDDEIGSYKPTYTELRKRYGIDNSSVRSLLSP